jgi:hypothetical protein
MTQIIAFAGKKQSGKNTCAEYIERILPGVDTRQFSFAEPLKRTCVDILGVPEELAYGNDAQKNTLVPHLLWENFPLPAWRRPDDIVVQDGPESPGEVMYHRYDNTYIPMSGPMTVREVLQYWGTNIFRRAYSTVWVDACKRAIEKSGCEVALITDTRFPDEVSSVKDAGGWVFRLTRNVFGGNHESERALDPDRYDPSNFTHVVPNRRFDINTQCIYVYDLLRSLGLPGLVCNEDAVFLAREMQDIYGDAA